MAENSRHLVPINISSKIGGGKMTNPPIQNAENSDVQEVPNNNENGSRKRDFGEKRVPSETVVQDIEDDEFDSNWSLENEIVEVSPSRQGSVRPNVILSPFAVPDYEGDDF